MPTIGQKSYVLSPTTDKCLSLAGEEFTRKLDLTGISNSWGTIRVALNCSITDTGGGNISNSFLYVGLSSGTEYPFGSDSCVHSCGFQFGRSSFSWTRQAGGGNPYFANSGYMSLRKVGTSVSSLSQGSNTFYIPATGGSVERRGWLSMTLKQGPASLYTSGNTVTATTVQADVWHEHFVYAASIGNPYVLEAATIDVTHLLNQSAGWNANAMDTVDIYWSDTSYPLNIHAITCMILP